MQRRRSIYLDTDGRGPWTVRTYRGIPIHTPEALVRAGTTNG